jgi:organic hydroperoxide reductase OsmC/OhrA
VLEIAVTIHLGRDSAEIHHLDRILSQFEPFCTVSQSVRQGIPITVAVEDGRGIRLK